MSVAVITGLQRTGQRAVPEPPVPAWVFIPCLFQASKPDGSACFCLSELDVDHSAWPSCSIACFLGFPFETGSHYVTVPGLEVMLTRSP